MGLTQDQQNRLETLKRLVSVRVEEYFEAPAEDDTLIPFGDIGYELHQAARFVLRTSPRSLSLFANRSYSHGVAIPLEGDIGAVVPLPSDYLRFSRLKMKGWGRPVTSYMPDTSEAYQHQQYAMRRGTASRPACFLVPYAQKYAAGNAPALLATQTEGKGIPVEGDILKDNGGPDVARVLASDDPDFIYVDIDNDSDYSAEVGSILTHNESGAAGEDGYSLRVAYLQDTTYYRTSAVGQALEVYPLGAGAIADFAYLPQQQAYELPDEFEDIMVWRATSAVLMTMRRYNDAEAALKQMSLAQQAMKTGMAGENRMSNG